ncbi:helix-turn-helix domain-containing protein, partial [Desulfobacula sp.]
MDEKIICRNIKKFRKQNHLTLEKLALLTGLTKGYLSKVERSQKAPPYSTLNKIAGALGIEVTQIFEENVEPLDDIRISFQKKNQRRIIKATSQDSGYDYEVLGADKPGKNMEPFIIHSPWEITKMYSHEGEEFIYVI